MRRRSRWVAALAAVALFGVAGCSAAGSNTSDAGRTNIVFWSWVPGIDKSVDLWNKTHSNIHVELQDTPAGSSGTYAKMFSAVRGGRGGPDVAQVEYQQLPAFVLENGLADLGPLGMNQRKSEFVDWQLAQTTFDGRAYAVPQASGPMALYYRADVFTDLGLSAPTTWDEYAADAAKIHASSPNRYISTFPPGNSAWFTALAWQAGAQWFKVDDGTWTVDVASPTTLKVAKYWDDLREKGLIDTIPDFSNGWYSDLQKGNIVAWPSAQWGGSLLSGNAPGTKGDWAVAPLPQWNDDGEQTSANWGGSATAVFRDSQHKQAAADFALWLNTDKDSIDLLVKGGYGWPATKGALDGTTLDAPDPFLAGQQNANRDVFEKADASINTDWQWSPTTTNTYAHLNDAFAAAVAGNGTFVDAVKQTQRETVADLKAKGLKVRNGS